MERLWELERAKLIAIILVVVGHVFGFTPPPGGEWWFVPESYIYLFHMPLFVFLSGFVFGWKDYHKLPTRKLPGYLRSRAERLLLPFLAMAVIIVAGKTLARDVAGVSLSDQSLLQSVLGVLGFYGFAGSPVQFIWYLYVIFLFSVATTILCSVIRVPLGVLMIAGLIVFFIGLPDVFYLFYVAKFYVFFACGIYAGERKDRFFGLIDRFATVSYLAFAALSALFLAVFWNHREFFASHVWVLALSIAAIAATLAFARGGWARRQAWMDRLSVYVFAIYLFNVPFIGFAKEIFRRIIPYTSDNMAYFGPLLVGAGLVGPILLRRLVLERSAYLKKMTA